MNQKPRSLIERLFGRRRALVLEWRYQIRSSLLPVISVALLLVLFIVTIHLGNVEATRRLAQAAPNLRPLLEGQDKAMLFLILSASGVYLLAVLLLGLIDSHRTVGALHHVEQRLKALRAGDWSTPLAIRQSDNFQDFGAEISRTLSYLRSGVQEDVAALGEVIERLEGAVSPGHPLGEVRRILSALRSRKLALLASAPLPSPLGASVERETAAARL